MREEKTPSVYGLRNSLPNVGKYVQGLYFNVI